MYGDGDIGRACARLAKACGKRVVAHRQHPERSATGPLVDAFASEPLKLAAQSDYLVVALPLMSATRQVVDARFLAALPVHADLVKVRRGWLDATLQRFLKLAAQFARGAEFDRDEHGDHGGHGAG